jgi:murein DD-endopeptidase MepM/ murein hydrolase activator NlpD
VEAESNNYISAFSRPSVRDRSPFSTFFRDLISYIVLRTVQIFRITAAFATVFFTYAVNLKGFIVRKMYWGRTSFYKAAFQIAVVIITLGALIASIGTRTDIFQTQEKGVIASSGIVGNNDLLLQVGTVDAITEAQVSSVDYEVIKYTVKRGDSLSTIAKEFGLKADTLRWANGIPSGRDTLRVGQVISIPPMDGVYYTVAAGDNLAKVIKKVKGANKYDLIELNNLAAPDYALHAGQKLFIPDATYTPTQAAKSYSSKGGVSYSTAPNKAVTVRSGTFTNPMQQCGGYEFVRGWRPSHTGVDLSGPYGCVIVAAGSGTVMKAGACGGGMGNCTVIRHDNGYSTLYMHGSGAFFVRSGQRVSAGQPIMREGCSGKCYGAHLHLSLAAPGVDVVNNYSGRMNPKGIIPY